MSYKRRDFLKLTGAATAGFTLASMTSNALSADLFSGKKKLDKFGLQLYSLRDDLPKDPAGVLKQVAEAGYSFVEPYTSDKGMFCGMSNRVSKSRADYKALRAVAKALGRDASKERIAPHALGRQGTF